MRSHGRARLAALACLASALAVLPAARASATPPIWESSFGAPLSISNDDDQTTSAGGETAVTFGAFSFPYYGTTYTGGTQIAVDTNGNVSLGTQLTSDNTPTGGELVASNPPRIAPFWADLLATDTPADQGQVFLNNFGDRLVVTWSENEFGMCPNSAYPACGDRVQMQLRNDGTIIFGYDLVYANPNGRNDPVMVGIARGNQDAKTDPGALSWSQRPQGSFVGDAGYELFASNPRAFDLAGRNLVLTPTTGGYAESITGPDLGVAISAPPTATVGQAITAVAAVSNHGTTGSSGNTTHLVFPGASIAGATPSQGACTVAGDRVSCSLGALDVGATASVSVSLTPGRTGGLHSVAGVTPAQPGDVAVDNQAAADTNVGDSGEPGAGNGSGPAITIRAKGGQRLSTLKQGLKVLVGCSTACDFQALGGLKGRAPEGAASASLANAGTTTVSVKLPTALLKKLRRARSATFTVTVDASSVNGESVKSSTLKVKR